MRIHGAGLALAGTLGLAALTGGAVLGPAVATAATTEQSAGEAVGDRVDRIRQALQGLVDDGTLTDEQREKVAATLAERLPRGGHGHGHRGHPALDVAATTLGMTEQDLLERLRDGRSLADVAAEKGVAVEDLTAALGKAAEDRLAQAVADGRLTQEQADARKADIAERVADVVERQGLPGRGHGRGPRGGPDGEAPAQQPPAE